MEFCSAASNVDPSTVLGSGPTKQTTVGQTTVGQAAIEQPTAQPAVALMTKEIVGDPTQERADADAPSRDEGAAATPPPSSGLGEEIRASSPARVEEPPVEAAALEGTPDLGKGPMMSSTMVGRSAEGEGTQAVSDDEVAEI